MFWSVRIEANVEMVVASGGPMNGCTFNGVRGFVRPKKALI
jgi:hypothetical protein